MRNIFLEKSYKNCDEKASHRPFHKSKQSISTVRNVMQFVFIVCPNRGLPKHIITKMLTTHFYLINF